MQENSPISNDKSSSRITTILNSFENGLEFTFPAESIKKQVDRIRITGDELFSLFTADIIKERTVFTR